MVRGSALLLALGMSASVLAQTGSYAPSTLVFGSQTVTTTSAAQAVTIANTHATLSFQVNGYTNTNASRFPIVAGGSCATPPFTLAAGQSCTVNVAFAPVATGGDGSAFYVTSTTPSATFTPTSVNFSGTGTAVPASYAPAAGLAFGTQTVTTTSAPRALTIANTHGSASLQINGYTNTNASRFPIVAGGSCATPPFTLAAGQSCTVNVAFAPVATGGDGSAFYVTSTTPSATFTPTSVNFSGTGTAVPLVLAPDLIDYGEVPSALSSAPEFVSLGNADLAAQVTIQVLTISTARFAVVAGGTCGVPPFTIAANQSCTVAVVYRPDMPGLHLASFSISTATPATTVVPNSMSLRGTGGSFRIFADGYEEP